MSFIIENPRRDDSRIKSRLIGQKPTCIIKVFPWQNPAILKVTELNFTEGGTPATDTAKARNQAAGTRKPSTIDNDIVRCSINKGKNSSSGGFSFVLKRGNSNDKGQTVSDTKIDYLRLISPGDWVMIYMKSDGEIDTEATDSDSGLKLVGIVENVRYIEIDDPTLGKPRLEYVVTGRDFGKILESDIYFNPVVASNPQLQQILGIKFAVESSAPLGGGPGKSPDEIIKSMIEFYVGGKLSESSNPAQQWYVPGHIAKAFGNRHASEGGGIPFFNLLNLKYIGLHKYNAKQEFQGVRRLLGESVMISAPASGTIWQALQAWANPALNELIVDLKKTTPLGKTKSGARNYKLEPAIQHRQVPFSSLKTSETSPFSKSGSGKLGSQVDDGSKTMFINLPRHVIQSTDVKQKNVGKSDFERINAIIVTPGLFNGEPLVQAYRMAINTPSIQRYGLKLLETQSAYGAKREEFLTHATKCVSLLCDWFLNAHLLYNGTIVTTGTDEFVEVGENLFIEDIAQLYQIEALSYIYEINQQDGGTTYNTEFQVSRGQRVENGTTKFIDNSVSGSNEDLYSTITTNTLENIRNNGKK